ncbi:ubiquitin carboxyl-terminal hydrolase 26 isoform X1 [Cucumis sativus]|uniref:Ubiquitin carboxyl-terminal hydrolase 26 n=1 Tax=Cucumis sativus TaxID=3659 RepID=A0A0A0LLS4_CUCSA|nr:ubiquitin carboxyl-terminal hydrolase 26 isoform X1 [Cucumis sativus]XP_011649775.1 ubiquitin carboxyl-terminal hydrolase 26 isoform X1 [Cucumis sativus]XP_011649776.1 ubiquitin carboxyl-terminal hydrolase 26 isoform X1 [Cucumis sativus]XP_011649777.1 ubiquitin carboxyl-terminal hydrolase 26 isoform X1 [Cucumis sativus]KGN62885.1 hypothetical protein Csa_022648 [Cucumis sativus]
MSRPTTRSKNKRHKQEDSADISSDLLRKIHSSGAITKDDINQLYMIWKPICQGCRLNTKDNPNCFCGLIPPPTGSRKVGLWQKISEIVQALGSDPSKDQRTSPDFPAGLTNLGATCYANSILQCLYMNKCFREGIFSVESDVLKQNPVLDQLVRLFALLHVSKMAYVDSFPFIKTLELDNGVQQDSHEFLTLLLSLLEHCLSHSKVSKAKTIVQDLFRGSVSHVTTCSQCGKDSEASSKMEDFYELELNVLGLKSLDESLNDYLSVEELHGDNQYFCESCKSRVNATRSIKLRTLPPVLNFQLKRCVFLPKTTTKKKITSALSFPGVLDMRERLSESSQSESIYDLSAVLIHKGTAVNSGHYIAHIKDENTGQWWEFDDEHVSKLGHHPFGEKSSNTNSKSVKTELAVPLGSKEEVNATAEGNPTNGVLQQSTESGVRCPTDVFSSNDAYMLMYNLRCTGKATNRVTSCIVNGKEVEGNMVPFQDGLFLPSHLCDEISSLNESHVIACQEYESKKEVELGCINNRRQEVRSILSEAPVHSLEEPFCWISTDWLRQWADKVSPPILDNSQIQCLHGKVPISKVTSIKRLSVKAWDKLSSKYGGGSKLTNEDICMECLIAGARNVVCADSYRDRRISMKEIALSALSGNYPNGTYVVSRTWLQQWVKRKILDAPSEADAEPTASIKCPHGQLLPEQAAGAKRVLIPEDLWLFIYEDALTVKPDDPTGVPTFPSDSRQCSLCSEELSEVAVMEDSIRGVKLKQRQNHERLAVGKFIPLSLNCKYYLVPTSWLSKWRNYINASGKSASFVEKPENLDGVINLLRCEKHSRLLERPPDLICKRATMQQKSAADVLTLISENDWKSFCEEWEGSEACGISAVVESSSCVGNDIDGSSKEKTMAEEDLCSNDEVNNGDFKQILLKTDPEICEECIGERESCELMQKLNYTGEDICVYFSRGKDAPKSILEASESTVDPDRRISKRARKTNSGNFVNLKVSGSTSVYQLKMMIWECFGVVKENQILRKGNRIIDGETDTLADKNIFPGDKLWVMDSEIHEHRDIADELSDPKMNIQHTEEGFRGTLLAANVSSEVV